MLFGHLLGGHMSGTDLPADLPSTTYTIVNHSDLDAFIERHTGRPWSLQQNGEYANDTVTFFEAYKDPTVSTIVHEWLASPIPQCPGRTNQPGYAEDVEIGTGQILAYLCNDGILPEGVINVLVSW